jgi:uncharacterized RDD family membrane protein YckC
MMENPYASPAIPADLEAELQPREMKIASQGKRFLNLIIDNIAIQLVSLVAGFFLGIVFVLARMSPEGGLSPQDETQLEIYGYVVGLFVSLAYFIFTEAAFQRTPGKLLTGTLVVTEDGGRPTLGQIVGRSFARFIPFEAFSFLGSNEPVGWHDSLSKTRVISLR